MFDFTVVARSWIASVESPQWTKRSHRHLHFAHGARAGRGQLQAFGFCRGNGVLHDLLETLERFHCIRTVADTARRKEVRATAHVGEIRLAPLHKGQIGEALAKPQP